MTSFRQTAAKVYKQIFIFYKLKHHVFIFTFNMTLIEKRINC